MPWSIATQPALDADALEDFKDQVRERSGFFDAELRRILSEAVIFVQGKVNRQLINTTVVYDRARFPVGSNPFYLPPSPLVSVTSVTYTDNVDDSSQTWDAANYDVFTNVEPGYLCPIYNGSYPTNVRDAVVTYTCGYGTTWNNVDPMVRRAVLMHAESVYRDTEWGDLLHTVFANIDVGDEHYAYP